LKKFLKVENAFHRIQNFRGQKSTVFGKILLENFSLYLLGHLGAKYQRSEKHLSPIWNFRGVKFNRFQKFFSVHLLQVLTRCVLADF